MTLLAVAIGIGLLAVYLLGSVSMGAANCKECSELKHNDEYHNQRTITRTST